MILHIIKNNNKVGPIIIIEADNDRIITITSMIQLLLFQGEVSSSQLQQIDLYVIPSLSIRQKIENLNQILYITTCTYVFFNRDGRFQVRSFRFRMESYSYRIKSWNRLKRFRIKPHPSHAH